MYICKLLKILDSRFHLNDKKILLFKYCKIFHTLKDMEYLNNTNQYQTAKYLPIIVCQASDVSFS